MLSSTSSSDARLPRLKWAAVLGGGFAIWLAFLGVLELRLAARGFKPDVIDTPALWMKQRERADALGSRALIVVGGSRSLLDLDLPTLRAKSGLEPVQLAVDGSSFVPVLAGIAADPRVDGTVLVDVAQNILALPVKPDTAYQYEAAYEQGSRHALPNFGQSEAFLTQWVRAQLRSYADGSRPLSALRVRILQPHPTAQYLRMQPDRQVQADYSQVPEPAFYYYRVARNLGQAVPLEDRSESAIERDFQARIAAVQPMDNSLYLQSLPAMKAMASAIRAHGGRVLFVDFPTGGYVRQTDDRRMPHELFWDRFAAAMDAPCVNFEDVPALQAFYLPDGSHMDYRETPRFTAALVTALGLDAAASGQPSPAGSAAGR